MDYATLELKVICFFHISVIDLTDFFDPVLPPLYPHCSLINNTYYTKGVRGQVRVRVRVRVGVRFGVRVKV